jgi:hypothetical protein
MPQTPRDYAYAALIIVAAGLVIGGAVVFQGAESFSGYVSGLLLLALAALSYLVARELKPKAAKNENQDPPAMKEEGT